MTQTLSTTATDLTNGSAKETWRQSIFNCSEAMTGNGSKSEREGVRQLRDKIIDSPMALKILFKIEKGYQKRCSCIFYSRAFCRLFSSSVELAMLGVYDRSKFVRYRSFELLACSLSEVALGFLEEINKISLSSDDRINRRAAMEAIQDKNIDLFVDIKKTGRAHLRYQFFGEEDAERKFGPEWRALLAQQREFLSELESELT